MKSRTWRSLRSKTRESCQFVCDLIHNKSKSVALIFESYVSVFCQIYCSVTIFIHVDPIKPGLHKVWCVLGSWRSTFGDRSIKKERMWGQLLCQKHVLYTNRIEYHSKPDCWNKKLILKYSKARKCFLHKQKALTSDTGNSAKKGTYQYQSHCRPEVPRGFQEVKVPRLRDNGPEGWWVCERYAPAAFTPRKYSWYSFLLEAESTPGP